MPRIPNFVPLAPGLPGPVAGGEPLLATMPDRISGMLNGYLGFQALACFGRAHLVGDLHYDGVGADLDELPPPLEDDQQPITPPPIRFRRTAGARHVALIGWQVCHEGLVKHAGEDVPSILKAKLQTTAGVLLDGPIVWSIDNGYLATVDTALGRVLRDAISIVAGEVVFDPDDPLLADAWLREYRARGVTPEQVFQTGWSADAIADEPRMLTYPDDCPDVVEVAFEAIGVRVYSACVIEAYQEELG